MGMAEEGTGRQWQGGGKQAELAPGHMAGHWED